MTEDGFGAIILDDDVFYNKIFLRSGQLTPSDIEIQTKKRSR